MIRKVQPQEKVLTSIEIFILAMQDIDPGAIANSISFTILGTPRGYWRTTQAGCKFDEKYERYQEYKNAVVAAFLDTIPGNWGDPKPLTTAKDSKTWVLSMFYFPDYTHPDPDNCHKAILDSLFACDKYSPGLFDFDYDPENPRIEVTIF